MAVGVVVVESVGERTVMLAVRGEDSVGRKTFLFFPVFFGKCFVLIFASVYSLSPLARLMAGYMDVLLPLESVVGVVVSAVLAVWCGVLVWRMVRS